MGSVPTLARREKKIGRGAGEETLGGSSPRHQPSPLGVFTPPCEGGATVLGGSLPHPKTLRGEPLPPPKTPPTVGGGVAHLPDIG